MCEVFMRKPAFNERKHGWFTVELGSGRPNRIVNQASSKNILYQSMILVEGTNKTFSAHHKLWSYYNHNTNRTM